jgi:hypothetical protein
MTNEQIPTKEKGKFSKEVMRVPQSEIDGKTLINIYSKGLTPLGRALTHFAKTPFVHPKYGNFNSMEGFWHWFKSVERSDILRELSGAAALNFGRTQTVHHLATFPEEIMEANRHKVDQHPRIKEMLIESTLPFDHYYYYGDGDKYVLIRPHCHNWLCRGFDDIRSDLKGEARKVIIPD